MRRLYTLVLWLALPLVLARLYWRGRRAPAYRLRWNERLGRFPPPDRPGGAWVHAVSVGEVRAAAPLIEHLLGHRPELKLTVTTTTPTGSAEVTRLFGDRVFHVYLPYDLPPFLNGFLDRVAPDLLIMIETEIWPNLLAYCSRRRIATVLANARLSARSARRYARVRGFSARTFGAISCIAAQADADARRFVELGVPADRVRVTGSIKFDLSLPASLLERSQVLHRGWGGRPVWIAASTHEGEEIPLLTAHAAVLERLPNALLVLVPRHPERFQRVYDLCRNSGLIVQRRSHSTGGTADAAVYLVDSMGELPEFLGAADVAFFGGSLVPVGGHNMLEAAAQGVPVLFGPHWFNFQSVGELLLERGGAREVADADRLAEVLCEWLGDASLRTRFGEQARQVVDDNRGALRALTELVDGLLPDVSGTAAR